MERKLASIQIIDNLKPIEGKDRILQATILGWSLIVGKDDFKVGDKCVYIEVDSVLDPNNPVFEQARKRSNRIKTIKMAGIYSQGIAYPLSAFNMNPDRYSVGDDVTDILKIKKYDPQAEEEEKLNVSTKPVKKYPQFLMRWAWFRKLVLPSKRQQRGFPTEYISRTDEIRCQNCPEVLIYKEPVVTTEKIDGCLTGDTMITTSEGQKRISYLFNHQEENPYVLSYNEDKGICEFKKVLEFHKIKKTRDIYKIGIAFRGHGNRPKFIHCTDNHKFLTNNGWKRADELQMTDKLKHYCKKINNELIEVILGCLIGDSSLNSNYREDKDYRTINFGHGIKQSDYFDYKKQLFGNYFIDQGTRVSGFGTEMRYGCLKANLALNKLIHDVCSVNGKKIITEKWANMLTPISLAFWYMDDGSITNRDNDNLGERIHLNTQGYSYEENIILQNALKNKFNIESKIGDKEIYKGYVLILDVENTDKFCNLVAPYICDSMKYKLPKKYENRECYFKNVTFDGTEGIVETDILSIEKEEIKDNYVFDLTVEDNENYFANNILVHNCSLTSLLIKTKTWYGKTKYEFILCSRNLRLWTPDNSYYWEMARKYNLEATLKQMIGDNKWVAIQGEVYGASIQKNPYKMNDRELRVFNVIYPTGRLGSVEAENICNKNGLLFVPILDTDFVLPDTVDEMLQYATAKSVINPNVMREGVVVRSKDGKHSFKAVSPEYLIKHEE